MKTMIKTLVAVLLLSGMSLSSQAQQKSEGTLIVTTRLKETNGTYTQRKLYRSFLEDFMKDCPYISHFTIHEYTCSTNNHLVIWTYNVNGWKDITLFYNWINTSLKSGKNDGLTKALTPYRPNYDLGGDIQVAKINKSYLVRNKMKK